MRPNRLLLSLTATAAALLVAARAPAQPSPAEFAAVRQQCIAAAGKVLQQEQAVATLDHDVELLSRDAAGRQRDLDDSRPQQQRLLEVLELFRRDPPDRLLLMRESAVERLRSEHLAEGLAVGLHAEAKALAGEVVRVAQLRTEIAEKQGEAKAAQQALAADRTFLAKLTAQRLSMAGSLLPVDAAADKPGREASDLGDLMKRADAAADRLDKALVARARAALPDEAADMVTPDSANPTRPDRMRALDPPQSGLTMPVSGALSGRFGAASAGAPASQGLRFAVGASALLVAPFDGRITYVGRFRDLGVVLIIRQGALYHAVLAGLGRADVRAGEWVLAGEPLGIMPDAGGALYLELRRGDRPVDPQPWLATRSAERQPQNANQRVRE